MALERQIEQQALSPPVLERVPAEVLLKIFSLCINEERGGPDSPYLSTDIAKGPWPLAEVCGKWRNIVVSTQLFWSHIAVKITHTDMNPQLLKVENILCLIRLQLERCPDVPLVIHLDLADQSTCEWTTSPYKTLASILAAHHKRWKKLKVRDTSGEFYDALCSFVHAPATFPSLERLYLYGPKCTFSSPYGQPPDLAISSSAPALRAAFFHYYYPSPAFPWKQLEILAISQYKNDWRTFTHIILPELTNLRELYALATAGSAFGPAPSVITLPSLETLRVADYAFRIFDAIEAPALRTLCMDVNLLPRDTGDIDSLIGLIDRSQCSVQALSCCVKDQILRDRPITGRILALLEALPQLRTLEITHTPPIPGQEALYDEYEPETGCSMFVDALLKQEAQGGSFKYCPQLSSLSLTWKDDTGEDEDYSPVVDLAERRWLGHGHPGSSSESPGNCVRLESVRLTVDDSGDIQVVLPDRLDRRLMALEDEGMRVSLVGFFFEEEDSEKHEESDDEFDSEADEDLETNEQVNRDENE